MVSTEGQRRAQCIALLAEAFRQKISPVTIAAYEMALDDLPAEAVEQAARQAIRSCKFMPNAAELRQLCGEQSAGDRALIAWAAVDKAASEIGGYKSVNFDDPTINAVVRNMGGWERFCVATVDEFDTWLRKEFLRTYELFFRSGVGDEQGAPLVGLHERSNRFHGEAIAAAVTVVTGLPAPQGRPRIAGAAPRIEGERKAKAPDLGAELRKAYQELRRDGLNDSQIVRGLAERYTLAVVERELKPAFCESEGW